MLKKIITLTLLTLAATGTTHAAMLPSESHRAVVNYAPIDWHEAFKVTKKENALLNEFLAQYEFPTLDQDPDAIHAINSYGATPLHYAMGHAEVTALLLARGADVNAKDNDGNAALHYAAMAGLPAIVTVLLEHGADIHATNIAKKTPFDIAKSHKNLDALRAPDRSFNARRKACAELLRTTPPRRCSIQ